MDAKTFLKRKAAAEGVSHDLGVTDGEPSSAAGHSSSSAPSATVYRDTTPSGIVVEYEAQPKRLYRVNGTEVPSVTSILGCLSKDGLSWWGMVQGVSGVLELFQRSRLNSQIDWGTTRSRRADTQELRVRPEGALESQEATTESVIKLLTAEKLTVNHQLTKAGDRGTNVHAALEAWAQSGGEFFPTPAEFPDEERPYVEGLLKFVDACDGAAKIEGCEVMVGSAVYGFAGRFDLVFELTEARTFVRKTYKRKDKVMSTLKKGRYLLDMKSSSGVYGSHHLQLAGYELASVESGYPETRGQLILHVTKDGEYELVPSEAVGEDFLAVKVAYDRLKRLPK